MFKSFSDSSQGSRTWNLLSVTSHGTTKQIEGGGGGVTASDFKGMNSVVRTQSDEYTLRFSFDCNGIYIAKIKCHFMFYIRVDT
jgi:hypothetical protein